MKLTKNQVDIVNFEKGSLLVTAGPGSGKTRVLIERTARLVSETQSSVLALTFSNKAAEEILERLELRLDEEEMENVSIGTIHSFCLDVVLTRGKMIGLPTNLTVIENDKDKIEIMKKVLSDAEISKMKKYNVQELLSEISRFKQHLFKQGLGEEDISLEEDFMTIFEAYNNLLIEHHLIDYDDILYYAYKLLTEKPQIVKLYSQLYKHVFVDEAQDLNLSQYLIIKALCSNHKNLMMIGDENQSIYGFNGSDSKYMSHFFVIDFSPEIKKLSENFRSTKKIINAAKSLINTVDGDVVYPIEGDLQIRKFDNGFFEAEWIADQIINEVSDGNKWIEEKVRFDNIAVIARNRYILKPLEEALKIRKIPYNFRMPNKPIESLTLEGKAFENGIKLLVNPKDQMTQSKLTPLFIEGFDDNEQRSEITKLPFRDLPTYKLEVLQEIQLAWERIIKDISSFPNAIKKITSVVRTMEPEINDIDFNIWKEQLMNDMDVWTNHWDKYCRMTSVDQRNLAHFKHQISLGRTSNFNSEGVTLSTVHMTKGLEYDMVFIMGLCEGVFPDYRAKTPQDMSEELNNMFVAITRAKRVCYLTYPESRMMPWGDVKKQSRSRFLTRIQNAI